MEDFRVENATGYLEALLVMLYGYLHLISASKLEGGR